MQCVWIGPLEVGQKCAVMVYCLLLFAMVLHVIGMWQPGIGDVCGHVAWMFICNKEALVGIGHWTMEQHGALMFEMECHLHWALMGIGHWSMEQHWALMFTWNEEALGIDEHALGNGAALGIDEPHALGTVQ